MYRNSTRCGDWLSLQGRQNELVEILRVRTLRFLQGGGLDSPRSVNTAKHIPSFLSLTLVRISTNIQRPTNVLA
jgi:hypothetical protein